MSDREDRAKSLASANGIVRDGERIYVSWDEMTPTERDDWRRLAEREGYSSEVSDGSSDQTNAAAYVATAMRSRLDNIALLVKVASEGFSDDDAQMEKEADAAESLGVGLEDGNPEEAAQEVLDQMPLCVEATTQFEIVLGTGGPDDRLIVECDTDEEGRPANIRRILYRYSWTGSGEVVLSGDDFAAAEALARRVVPELIE